MVTPQDHQARSHFHTGFRDLDGVLAQADSVDVALLAARPRMGKTALALSITRNLAVDEGEAVAIFSLEHAGREVNLRLACQEAHIDRAALPLDAGDTARKGRLGRALEATLDAPIYIDDRASLGLAEIETAIWRLKQDKVDLALAVIDYVELMPGIVSADHVRQQVSHGLRTIAHELSVPILLLAQLPRRVDEREDPRPIASDVEAFGGDVTLLLYRDEVYDPDSPDKGTAEITVGGPNGLIGHCRLGFASGCGRFSDFD